MFLPRETILIYSLLLSDTRLEKKIYFCFAYIQYKKWGYYIDITITQLSKLKYCVVSVTDYLAICLQHGLCKLQLNVIYQNIPFFSYIFADIAYLLETCLFEARLST